MKLVYNKQANPETKISTVMNMEGNTLFIYDYIRKVYNVENQVEDPNNITSEEFLSHIRSVGNTSDIEVRINSKGGELGYSLAVYQTLRECKNKVTTVVDGYAYSCAGWVMLSGDERYIMPGGILMYHNPIIDTTVNNENSFEDVMPQWRASRESIASIIVDRTGMKKEDVLNMMNKQTFLNADEAVKLGFCTGIRDGRASIPNGVRNYLPSEICNAIPEVSNTDYSDLLSKTTLLRAKKLTNR